VRAGGRLSSAGVSREDIELVESAFEAWNRGDVGGFADHMADDVVWLEVSGWLEQEGREVHGREPLERNLVRLLDAWESYRLELERLHEAGDRVVAVVRELARGRSSGAEVDSLWGYVITVADGKLARVEAYRDPTAALAAVGLPSRR
jgi:ketosteroid isomerase-like protein